MLGVDYFVACIFKGACPPQRLGVFNAQSPRRVRSEGDQMHCSPKKGRKIVRMDQKWTKRHIRMIVLQNLQKSTYALLEDWQFVRPGTLLDHLIHL